MKYLLILAVLVGGALSAPAQRHDLFIGYQYITQTGKDQPTGVSANYAYYFGKRIAPTVDFGYNRDSDNNSLTTIMSGVTVKPFRSDKAVQPYVRGLVGVARRNGYEAWSADVGAGIDFSIHKSNKYKLRIGADYLRTYFDLGEQNQTRVVAGVVF